MYPLKQIRSPQVTRKPFAARFQRLFSRGATRAYRFAGFLATPPIVRPTELPPQAVWREIPGLFEGCGVRLPTFIGKAPEIATIQTVARALGLEITRRWVYLTYDCWGRQIDFVYGVGCCDGQMFGPIEADGPSEAEVAFTAIMAKLGLSPEQAMQFPAFERGFWSEP